MCQIILESTYDEEFDGAAIQLSTTVTDQVVGGHSVLANLEDPL